MQWISVNERLPEEGVKVLTIDNTAKFNPYKVDYLVHFPYEKPPFIWACRLEDEYEKVTHWMPLPEGPKN